MSTGVAQIRSVVGEFTALGDRYMHISGDRTRRGPGDGRLASSTKSGTVTRTNRSCRTPVPGERDAVAMAAHQQASVALPSDPASVSAARKYVSDILIEWGLPGDAEVADTVRLIVSELATNAIQHTLGQSPTFTVD